jgi:hypothetical protein
MWEVEDHFRVRLGGNTFIDTPDLVTYQRHPLFTLKRHDDNNYLGIYFEIFDAARNHIASVKRNEIYSADKNLYAVERSQTRCAFLERATGRILCEIKRYEAAQPAELDVSVSLYTPVGFLFEATPDQMNFPMGNVIRGATFRSMRGGINID